MRIAFHLIGTLLKYLGILMLIPSIFPVIYGENDLYSFLISGSLTFLFGLAIEKFTRVNVESVEIERSTAFIVVSMAWITASIFGSLPYIVYGVFSTPIDAIFESASGFTTTGASVMTNVEIFPHGIMFWRNFTQWLGGMGIIVLAIAILPRLSVGGMQLMGLEASGPDREKLSPRIAETAKKLWGVYIALSALLAVLLIFSGLSFYDSLIHSFSTMATGGFSNNNLSIAAYDSALVEGIITFFMFLAGVNFTLHYFIFKGKFSKVLRNSELRFFLLMILILLSVMILDLRIDGVYQSFTESLRYASFQLLTAFTSAGFATANFDTWPSFTKFILIIVMLTGGCAGSTSGAIKSIRILVLIKSGYREIIKLISPHIVNPIKLDGKVISENAIFSIGNFVFLYISIFLFSSLVVMFSENVSIITAISACAATMGNVGPGLEQVGPMENYAFLNDFTKLYLSILMIIGRLELYAMLVLITPFFWRK